MFGLLDYQELQAKLDAQMCLSISMQIIAQQFQRLANEQQLNDELESSPQQRETSTRVAEKLEAEFNQ